MTISLQGLWNNLNNFNYFVLKEYKMRDYEWFTLKEFLDSVEYGEDVKSVYDRLNSFDWETFVSNILTEAEWLTIKPILEPVIKERNRKIRESIKESDGDKIEATKEID